MTTLQEAARDALEALERIGKDFVCRSAHHAKKDQHSAFAECPVVVRHTDAIESLKAALAQQGEVQHAGDTRFEGWLSEYKVFGATGYIKQDMRNAYWAGYSERAPQAPQAQQVEPEVLAHDTCRAESICRRWCGNTACVSHTAAPAQEPVAYITQTEQGPMVWTPEMYDEACTYCDDGEFPVPLYTVAPRPTSGDYALGYAEGFNDACKPAPQAQDKSDNYLSGYCTGRTDLLKEQSAHPVAQPLSDSEIEKLREKTFSTYNPYCPVDSKSMRKAVRAAEAAHGIGEVK